MASLVLVSAMCIEFVVAVEALSTEAAFGMTFEPTLIHRSRVIVAKFLMLLQFWDREQLMLVGEDLFVPGTEVAHDFVMGAFDMAMKVRPAPTRNVTAGVGAVVAQQQDCVVVDFYLLVLDPKNLVHLLEISVHELFVSLCRIVCEYDMLSFCLESPFNQSPPTEEIFGMTTKLGHWRVAHTAMSACSCLVQSSQSQSANMAGPVVAWCNRCVHHRRSTDEADFDVFGLPILLLGCEFALIGFGIFGRVITKGASTTESRKFTTTVAVVFPNIWCLPPSFVISECSLAGRSITSASSSSPCPSRPRVPIMGLVLRW